MHLHKGIHEPEAAALWSLARSPMWMPHVNSWSWPILYVAHVPDSCYKVKNSMVGLFRLSWMHLNTHVDYIHCRPYCGQTRLGREMAETRRFSTCAGLPKHRRGNARAIRQHNVHSSVAPLARLVYRKRCEQQFNSIKANNLTLTRPKSSRGLATYC
jgi:hypothetical protein